jgi:hypothetical protein
MFKMHAEKQKIGPSKYSVRKCAILNRVRYSSAGSFSPYLDLKSLMGISLETAARARFFLQVIPERDLSEEIVELELFGCVKLFRLAVSIGVIASGGTEVVPFGT